MKKLNLRIPALLLVVIMIMAFAVPVFAANSSDAAAAETTEAVESAGRSFRHQRQGTGCCHCHRPCCRRRAIAMGVVAGKSAEGIARQPEAQSQIRTTLMLSLVFIETAIIYALLVVILIIFVL